MQENETESRVQQPALKSKAKSALFHCFAIHKTDEFGARGYLLTLQKKTFFVHFARWVLKQKKEKNMGMKNANASNFQFKWLTGFYWTVHTSWIFRRFWELFAWNIVFSLIFQLECCDCFQKGLWGMRWDKTSSRLRFHMRWSLVWGQLMKFVTIFFSETESKMKLIESCFLWCF